MIFVEGKEVSQEELEEMELPKEIETEEEENGWY